MPCITCDVLGQISVSLRGGADKKVRDREELGRLKPG